MKRFSNSAKFFVLAVIFFVSAGFGLYKVTAGAEPNSPSWLYIQVDSPYYWATPNHNEWRVWLKVMGGYPASWRQCINWEYNITGTWYNYGGLGDERIAPDGNIGSTFQVRVKVKYNIDVTLYSDPITIGEPPEGGEWPGGDPGAYYGYCDL